jgi:Na+:H+ antiporter, NhaA family
VILSKLFSDFFQSERAGGLVLILCTVLSLTLTNIFPAYHDLWNIEFQGHHVTHWINDGLMAIFFLMIGLELEREIYAGELSSIKNAILPIVAAFGGMIVPATIYFLFNPGENLRGFGIPMATDIAFAIGVLSLLGNRVPVSLKIFLTALAVIDDLGAILVIAIFYTSTLSLFHLGVAGAILIFLFVLNRLKVNILWPYLLGGVFIWYFMLHSGVHATLAGVLLAFVIPFGTGDDQSISIKLQHWLHRPVAFIILPLFALANTSIFFPDNLLAALTGSISLGIMVGLLFGKPIGIFLFSFVAVKFKIGSLPSDSKWSCIFGASILGGIGFTMSIFISLLAFDDPSKIDQSKIAIMMASLLAALIGLFFLKAVLSKASNQSS